MPSYEYSSGDLDISDSGSGLAPVQDQVTTKPMLTYHQFNRWKHISMKCFFLKFKVQTKGTENIISKILLITSRSIELTPLVLKPE